MAIKLVKAKVLDTDWWFILISMMLQLNRETMKKKLEKKTKNYWTFSLFSDFGNCIYKYDPYELDLIDKPIHSKSLNYWKV